MTELPPVLIVDDDPDDVFILRRLIGKAGIQNKTISFEDPRSAISHLQAEIQTGNPLAIPCVVFSDLNMPQMTGDELTRWIRTQPALKHVVVVVVSSSEDPADAARVQRAGAHRFLLKYPPASVVASIVKSHPSECS